MSCVWKQSSSSGTDRLVLLAIADAADDDGTNAWPSVATIAAKCKVSPRTVQRSLGTLVELGELAVEKQAGGSPSTPADKRPNRYAVLLTGVTGCRAVPDSGVTPREPRGDKRRGSGVTAVSPNPSLDTSEPVLPPQAPPSTSLALVPVNGTAPAVL